MFLAINGKTFYLWGAVDQQGNVLDILVQMLPKRFGVLSMGQMVLSLLRWPSEIGNLQLQE